LRSVGVFVILVYVCARDFVCGHAGELEKEINRLFFEDRRPQGSDSLWILPIIIPDALLLARELTSSLHHGSPQLVFGNRDVVLLTDLGKHQTESHSTLSNGPVLGFRLLFSRVFIGKSLFLGL